LDLNVLSIIFQIIAFLLAISVHESAHAWMANRCGDPTAKMLGRITLNPIKHIDPIGTVLLPLIGMLSGLPVIGWAKPCPVDPRNFKHPVRDDVYTSVVGPISNLMLVAIAMLAIIAVSFFWPEATRLIVSALATGQFVTGPSFVIPFVWFCFTVIVVNVLLFVFNLLPIPPLDGSHVLRHMLPDGIRDIYDKAGIIGLILLLLVGGRVINALMAPVMGVVVRILLSF
jgi:Zn-dependent protease